MKIEFELLTDEQIYERLMREEIPYAKHSVVIATALAKQTTIEITKGEVVPFLKLADDLLGRNVMIRILFAGKPSKSFIEGLNSFARVKARLLSRVCPRNHMKIVLIDGARLYLGSANLTGAGMGKRSHNKRNFEFGLFTTDFRVIKRISKMLQDIWEGEHCGSCQTKRLCKFEHERFASSLGRPSLEERQTQSIL